MFIHLSGVFCDASDTSSNRSTEIASSSSEVSYAMGSFSAPLYLKPTKSCSEATVTKFIKSVIPDAELVENTSRELTYCLPVSAVQGGQLFTMLDESMENLHVGSYGISDTTLEEVKNLFQIRVE